MYRATIKNILERGTREISTYRYHWSFNFEATGVLSSLVVIYITHCVTVFMLQSNLIVV